MKRVIILLLDSFGIGSSADAEQYGDQGANTFGHIVQYCEQQRAAGPLQIPHLTRLGLWQAAALSTGNTIVTQATNRLTGAYGYAVEQSLGKDTPSGHWEMMGVPVKVAWGYFPPEYPSFPQKLLTELIKRAKLPGVLGNKHASGTQIIADLGLEHMHTGKPIVYTSADSVFQIAAHEQTFGLQRLYDCCQIARELVDEYNIGRVIARPFLGDNPSNFYRTGNRRDLAIPPPQPTLLDELCTQSGEVIAIGKIADIFAHRGISQTIRADGNMALFDAMLTAMEHAQHHSLIFTNFVDFDSRYGHRRNIEGYAQALEEFDARLPELFAKLQADDMVFITADHGCDPTWPGSDHTREHIPIIVFGPKVKSVKLGKRDSFADIGQTIADYFGLPPLKYGKSFYETMCGCIT